MINLIKILPLIGILLLISVPTSADLNDEVALKSNQIKAASKSLEIQSTVDNSRLPYLFNLNNFQSDSLGATTVRIRNTGEVNVRYFMSIKQTNTEETCGQPKLKVLKDEEVIFNDTITKLDMEMVNLEPGKKNDLVILMSMNDVNTLSSVVCNYQMEIATDKNNEKSTGLWDRRRLDSKVEIVGGKI